MITYIFKPTGDTVGRFYRISTPHLQTTTALKDDILIEVSINIIAPIRCFIICERQNYISTGK